MANIVSDQTEISYAESVTGWSGDSFVLEPEIKVQGTNSLAVIQTANGVNDVIYTGGPWNMAGKHLRMYGSSNISANMDVTNAIQIYADDGTNTAFWTVANSASDYAGGWQDFFVDIDSTPTTGTVNSAAITSVGLRINTATKPRNGTNGWYDNWRFGNGLTINSTAAEAITFQEVAVEDKLVANAWDIIQDTDGVLFTKGKLTLGSAGALNCNLVSEGETIYFIDRVVSSTLYALVTQIGTGTTDIDISGLTCKTVGLSAAEIDFSTPITSLSISGSSFTGMGACSFYTGASVQSSSFNSCTSITTNGATFDNQNINTSGLITVTSGGSFSGNAIKLSTGAVSVTTADLSLLTGNSFTSDGSNHAVELTSLGAGSMTWDSVTTSYDAGVTGSPITPTATGNEDLHINAGTGTITINVAAGATTPSVKVTGGATVNVVAGLVTATWTVAPSLTGFEYAIYTVTALGSLEGAVEVQHVESTVADNFAYTYTYAPGVVVAVQIIDDGAHDFIEAISYYTLAATDQSNIINLNPDSNN